MAKGRILRVKQGYNPNSSSIGSVVFTMSAAVVPATMILGMAAGAISTAILNRVGKREDATPVDPLPSSQEAGSNES